jgi:hypothetical protein
MKLGGEEGLRNAMRFKIDMKVARHLHCTEQKMEMNVAEAFILHP